MTEYFSTSGFEPKLFVEDLKNFDVDLHQEDEDYESKKVSVEEEAMRYFALLIVFHIYTGQSADVENNVVLLFEKGIQDEPLWTTLKNIMFSIVQQINGNSM
mmetsp:Transcript_2276/g.3436  ORF Transcript_2276/g.3436 Transcript_2276/m.3436 type:complete len:102 (+) Transcript_2276:3968-4273(+)